MVAHFRLGRAPTSGERHFEILSACYFSTLDSVLGLIDSLGVLIAHTDAVDRDWAFLLHHGLPGLERCYDSVQL